MRGHRITIAFPKARSARRFTPVLDFAEGLEQALKGKRGARVENPDSVPRGEVYVAVISDGRLRPTLKIIQAYLEEHHLTDQGTVTVSSGVES